jgi:phosphate starvation-inducible protein PhoH and related proteins
MAKAKYQTRKTPEPAAAAIAKTKRSSKSVRAAAPAPSPAERKGKRSSAPNLGTRTVVLEPMDNERIANLNGPFDAHLRQIELRLGVVINTRGNIYAIQGEFAALEKCEQLLRELFDKAAVRALQESDLFMLLKDAEDRLSAPESDAGTQEVVVKTRKGSIKGRGSNQRKYLHQIAANDINFGIGPAGTGKTYLAVAMAVEALESNRVQRLLLVRPAVEAGEKLGFLPGDLVQKVDPYLRPLYDALYEMLGVEKVGRLLERNVIEIAPLAFMRGRTLNDAFILLDEAQNTTVEQMKMFLTRIGFGSTAVVTGDMTQVDLPKHVRSGLRHAMDVLKDIEGISFTFFEAADVVRHPLVQRIVMAYEKHELAAARAEQKSSAAHGTSA